MTILTSAGLRPVIERALARVLERVSPGEPPADLAAQATRYARTKGERGAAPIAAELGLERAELQELESALQDAVRTAASVDSGETASERNAVLASVRLLSWFETIAQRVPELGLEPSTDALAAEELGRKQVRALELIVRSLVTESYGSQDALVARLRAALDQRVVERWQKTADPGDVLSGCSFSELASLFTSSEEFQRYEKLYEDTPFLTLLRERRRTIQAFLDDVRRIRNVLAHHKRVTNLQLTLLDLYYDEIVAPVRTAHERGETKVDPARFLDVSKEELEAWFSGLEEDLREVKDDLRSLRASLLASLGRVEGDVSEIRRRSVGTSRRLGWVGAGLVVVLGLSAWLVLRGGKTEEMVAHAGDAATRAAEAGEAAASTARDTAARVEQGVERTAVATAKLAETLDELRDGFKSIAHSGGVVAEPTRPQEWYHNARTFEQRGDVVQALDAYRHYFAYAELPFVDPHQEYQSLVKLQNGIGGAREVYDQMRRREGASPVFELMWDVLLEHDQRVAALGRFIEKNPDWAPAVYELSLDYSEARLGSQSLEDKKEERDLLQEFLTLHDEGHLLGYFLDQSVAAEEIADARRRLARLATLAPEVVEKPVRLTAMHSGQGWMVTLSIAELAKEIFVRVGDEGAFKSTGFVPGVVSVSGLPVPRPLVELSGSEPTVLHVKYVDAHGGEHGPYDVPFDPDVQMLEGTKNVLEMTKNSWLAFGDQDSGKVLLYFTHLLSWRAGVAEIHYALDADTPETSFPVPAVDPKNPNAIGPDDQVYVEVPPETRYATVQVTFRDGTTSDVVKITR